MAGLPAWARHWITDPDPLYVQWVVAYLFVSGYIGPMRLTLAQASDVLHKLRQLYAVPVPPITYDPAAWPGPPTVDERTFVTSWKTWLDANLAPGVTAAQMIAFLRAVAARLTLVWASYPVRS